MEQNESPEQETRVESHTEEEQTKAADQFRAAEVQPEEPTTIVQQAKEKLEIDREAYLELYKQVVDASREEDRPDLLELRQTLSVKRVEYLGSKKGYGEALVQAHKRELLAEGKQEEELDEAISLYVRTEIFQRLVIDEENLLIERRSADYPPSRVGVLKRMYQRWDSFSVVQKTLITTTITTGLALGVTALSGKDASLEATGVALFFSKAFLTNLGQDLFTGLVGSGVSRVLISQIEKSFHEQIAQEQEGFVMEGIEEMSKRYHDLLDQKMRRSGLAMVGSALATVASGRAFSIGLDWLTNSSLLRDIAASTSNAVQTAPDVMSRLSETETVSKPGVGILKRALSFFKKSSDIEN